ncbi:uncharacterized protein LOC105843174 [Hydra vulgaris]|uniref:uncharacterized protein LOC105843174 n=1 Tax=Hydra vulgaris TaxID=6087 RepID=UPI00064101C8|nr:uncharacterized protein LOC105843174 [Hydra vulgaris]
MNLIVLVCISYIIVVSSGTLKINCEKRISSRSSEKLKEVTNLGTSVLKFDGDSAAFPRKKRTLKEKMKFFELPQQYDKLVTLKMGKRDIFNIKDLLKAALINSSQKTRDVILGLLQKPTAWLLANAREIVKLIGEKVDDESSFEDGTESTETLIADIIHMYNE